MKLEIALRLMKGLHHEGFRVHFERRGGGFLESDVFPGRDEKPLETPVEAWELAEQFAEVDPEKYVNVYVIDGRTFVPYSARRLNVYPPRAAR